MYRENGDGSKGFAHFLLCGASLISLSLCPTPTLCRVTFTALLLYGITGFLHYAIPDMHNSMLIIKCLAITHMLTRNLTLPCVVTYLYSIMGYSSIIAYTHLILGIIPILLYLLKHRPFILLVDLILAVNIISLLYISIEMDNMWGIGLGVCHILNHFLLNHIKDDLMAPIDCLFVVGMCFFNIFAIKTVKNC